MSFDRNKYFKKIVFYSLEGIYFIEKKERKENSSSLSAHLPNRHSSKKKKKITSSVINSDIDMLLYATDC
jgi:hypothetical protein